MSFLLPCNYYLAGHLTFQCRNYLRSEQNGNIDMDISSTSSDSEDDEMLKEAIAKRKAELGESIHINIRIRILSTLM